MVVFNPQKKEIDIKVVYYGPALCGKTTNLKSVHLNLNPQQRGELISLATKDDRTLFFDFLPIQLENIKGFTTRFHIYTVPGQVFYTLTRKAVLTGVDGVIFVADSQNGKMKENIESLNDLKDNLKYYNKTLDSIPLVFQYNKRDMPDLITLDEMNDQLNSMRAPYFEACALSGKGVMDTLTMCCKMVLKQMQNKTKIDRPVSRPAAEQPAAEPPSAELPQLTIAESSPVTADESANPPLLKTEEQPATDPDSAGTIDLSMLKPPQILKEPADSQSAAAVEMNIKQAGAGEEMLEGPPVPAGELTAPREMKNEDGKRMCPRCSLKFKPNVKQCPICRISLVPEDQETITAAILPPAAPPAEHEHETVLRCNAPDADHNGHQVEIVSCEQPLKATPHAITIPLRMRIKENNAEVKVELTISINNVNHHQQY